MINWFIRSWFGIIISFSFKSIWYFSFVCSLLICLLIWAFSTRHWFYLFAIWLLSFFLFLSFLFFSFLFFFLFLSYFLFFLFLLNLLSGKNKSREKQKRRLEEKTKIRKRKNKKLMHSTRTCICNQVSWPCICNQISCKNTGNVVEETTSGTKEDVLTNHQT